MQLQKSLKSHSKLSDFDIMINKPK